MRSIRFLYYIGVHPQNLGSEALNPRLNKSIGGGSEELIRRCFIRIFPIDTLYTFGLAALR